MPKSLNSPAASVPLSPPPPEPMVKETVTRTTMLPAAPLAPAATIAGKKPAKDSVDAWFAALEPEYRANHCSYYLYRLDPNIAIVNPDLDGRANGSMLDRLTAEVISRFSGESFLGELQVWTKQNYGGGNFEIKVNDTKQHRLMYDLGFKVEGAPKLSSREAYTSGAPTPGQAGSEQSLLPTFMRVIDEKLSALSQNRPDPTVGMSQTLNVMMEGMSKAFQFALERQPKTPDGAQQLDQMRMMFEMVKTLFAEKQPGAPQKSTVEQLKELREMLALAREMEGPKETGGLTLATFKDALIEGLRSVRGGGRGGSDMAGWVEVAKALAPRLDPLIAMAVSRIGQRPQPGAPGAPAIRIQQPAIGPVAPVGRGAGGPPPPGAGAIPPGYVQAQPQAPAPSPQPPAPSAEPRQIEITPEIQDAVLWNACAMQIVDALTHGVTGDDMAFAVDKIYPQYAIYMGMATAEQLMQKIATDPVLSAVKDDPRLPAFVESFLQYFKAEPAEPDGDGELKPN